MPTQTPTATLTDLRTLDESEVLLGYMSGFEGEAAPDVGATRSFLHGWRNGALDGGFREPDEADPSLATAPGVLV